MSRRVILILGVFSATVMTVAGGGATAQVIQAKPKCNCNTQAHCPRQICAIVNVNCTPDGPYIEGVCQ